MKKLTWQKAYIVVVVVLSFLMSSLPGSARAATTAVDLGAAAPFGGFGGSAGVTNQGIFTVVNGDIGTTAITSAVTGLHDTGGNVYTETSLNIGAVNGTVFTATAPPGSVPGVVAAAAALAAQTAFNNLSPAALPGGIDVSTLGGGAGALGGRTLAPGIYKSVPGSFSIRGGNLTLDAAGNPNAVWVFQMASTLTVGGPGAAFPQSVILINGAQAGNVFWQVGSAATINAAGGGTMVGTIIASSGTAFSTAGNVNVVKLNGRALVLHASLTLVNTIINVPATPTVTAATMVTPVNGTTIPGASQAFTWTNAGAGLYQVWVGSTTGTFDIGFSPQTVNTTATISGLPVNGSTLHVRLWSLFGTTWIFNDYTYTASATSSAATIVTPVNGTTLSNASQAFTWTNAGASLYQVWVGSSAGTSNLGFSPQTKGTTATVSGIPASGTVFVRLWSLFGITWSFNDYTYTAAAATGATMVTPVNGSTISGASQAFTWTNAGAIMYQVWVGSSAGTSNLGFSPQTTETTTTLTGLPTSGTVFVRLWSLFGTTWFFNDYSYTAGP